MLDFAAMCAFIDRMNIVNMFRKRKYSTPLMLRGVKVKMISDKLALVITAGIADKLDSYIEDFKRKCNKADYQSVGHKTIIDYVRVNNSVLYGIVGEDIAFINKKFCEVDAEDLLKDPVDISGDLVLDLRNGLNIKLLFLVKAIRES